MNSLVLLGIGLVVFFLAYVLYGGWLAKKWGVSKENITPAHRLNDNRDFVPTDVKVVMGHHFSSIAGAGPITGPILAAIFGWVPVYLWILIGCTFLGGVHDFGSLVISLRHDGKSIGETIRTNISPRAKKIFNWYAWLTLTLVVAAFTDICAQTFAFNPAAPEALTGARAGTASVLFIFLAIAFGVARNRFHASLLASTVIGVIFLGLAIAAGYFFPLIKLGVNGWRVILLLYIVCASVLPVWLLLQPRDYLCSFLLYAMIAGAFAGLLIRHPDVEMSPFIGFQVNGQFLFPFLFVTVACGAISGFHSLVSSGTTSKQLNKEVPDAKIVGYGSMLIEGVLAIIALIVVGYLSSGDQVIAGAPAQIFANGVAWFMSGFGIPEPLGQVFITLAYSAFALTSLDTATRIGRYVMQEIAADEPESPAAEAAETAASGAPRGGFVRKVRAFASNMYGATVLTVGLAVVLLIAGYTRIWPIFGSANQLLAALALLAITAHVIRSGKKSWETVVPLVFMFAVTLTAIGFIVVQNLPGQSPDAFLPLALVGVILFILAVMQIVEAIRVLCRKKQS